MVVTLIITLVVLLCVRKIKSSTKKKISTKRSECVGCRIYNKLHLLSENIVAAEVVATPSHKSGELLINKRSIQHPFFSRISVRIIECLHIPI